MTRVAGSGEDRTWRFSWFARIIMTVLGGGFAAGGLVVTVAGIINDPKDIVLMLMVGGFGVGYGGGLVLYVWRSRMSAGPSGVTIRRMFTVTHVPWADLKGCSVGKYGLTIQLPRWNSARSSVPQSSLVHRQRNRETCQYLEQRAAQARAKRDGDVLSVMR